MATASGAVSACGHLPFDDLPADQQALLNEGGAPIDGATLTDGPGPNPDGGFADSIITDPPLPDTGVIGVDASTDVCLSKPNCTIVYVAKLADADTAKADGSRENPFPKIQTAIDFAATRPHAEIHISSTLYEEDLTIADGTQLYGGYSCTARPCSWGLGGPAAATIIESDGANGIAFGPDITRNTVLQNLTIKGSRSAPAQSLTYGAAAITVIGGAPTLSQLTVTGGNPAAATAANRRSIGIAIAGKASDGPLIDHCQITAIAADTVSSAIVIEQRSDGKATTGPGAVQITNSQLSSGVAKKSYGLVADQMAQGSTIQNNTIVAGNSSGTDATDGSWAVSVSNSGGTFDQNKINIGVSPTCNMSGVASIVCGGIFSHASTVQITNNLIDGAFLAKTSLAILLEAGPTADGNAGTVLVHSNVLNTQVIVNGTAGSVGTSAGIGFRNSGGGGGGPVTIGRIYDNIIQAGQAADRYAIFEVDSPTGEAHPLDLEYNDLWGATTALYLTRVQQVGKGLASIDAVNTFEPTGSIVAHNLNDDPLAVNGNAENWNLQPKSTLINAGSDAFSTPKHDFYGNKRPIGAPDIGPAEDQLQK